MNTWTGEGVLTRVAPTGRGERWRGTVHVAAPDVLGGDVYVGIEARGAVAMVLRGMALHPGDVIRVEGVLTQEEVEVAGRKDRKTRVLVRRVDMIEPRLGDPHDAPFG